MEKFQRLLMIIHYPLILQSGTSGHLQVEVQSSQTGDQHKQLIIDDIISNNLDQVKQFRDGNSKLLGFFVGQVMKATQGKANPKQVNQILNEKLS